MMIVGSVVMGPLRSLSPLGTKNASIALFAGISHLRIWRQAIGFQGWL